MARVHLAAVPAPGLRPNAATFHNNMTATYNVFAGGATGGRSQHRRGRPARRSSGCRSTKPPPYVPVDEDYPPRRPLNNRRVVCGVRRFGLDDLPVQGVEATDRELLDAQALVGHLVAEGSMFEFLAEHRQDLFPDVVFEDLFPSGKGRPSIPASVMASILVLQSLHDLSDRETAEAARCDLRWKVAAGMALDDAGFDASTLVYWRRRLATIGAAAPDQRCGQGCHRADRGAARSPETRGGFHDPG